MRKRKKLKRSVEMRLINMVPWKRLSVLINRTPLLFFSLFSKHYYRSISHESNFSKLGLWMLDKILNFSLSNTVREFPTCSSEYLWLRLTWIVFLSTKWEIDFSWFFLVDRLYFSIGWSQLRITTLQNYIYSGVLFGFLVVFI